MADQTHIPQDDELEGFETFEESAVDDIPADDPALDADFQDISDDMDADVFGEEEPAPVQKKKTNWFNIGVAVVAIGLAGGLIWMKLGPQIMGGDTGAAIVQGPMPTAQAPDTQANPQTAAQQAVAPAGNSAPAAATPGLLDNPDQFANLGSLPAPDANAPAATAAPAADPFAGVPNKPTPDAQAAAKPAVSETVVPMPAPITPAPAIAAAPIAPIVPEQAAPAAKADTAMPAPVVAAIPDTSALETKVNTLETRLDAMDSKLSAIQSAPSDNKRLDAIQTSLERLETRLDDMASRKSAPVVREASVSPDDEVAPAPKKAPAKKKAAPKPKPSATTWDQPYKPSHATPVPTASGGWELRGAQPNRAVIAKGSDIREVGVGETVPGLGEITGVAQINGAWIVQGTSGRLSQ